MTAAGRRPLRADGRRMGHGIVREAPALRRGRQLFQFLAPSLSTRAHNERARNVLYKEPGD